MKKIRYYDLLRIISFCFIIFYHMMIQLQISGIYPPEKVSRFFMNDNMHIATLAVAVFFMLSGACLAYTTKDNFSIKEFYKKRFLKTLIPFYMVSLAYYVFKAISYHSLVNMYANKIPAWRIIYTLLGLDGWIDMHYIPTFTLGVGEWFLGALLILYLVFPLLRYLMTKYKVLFLCIATCIYIYVAYNYTSVVPIHMNLILKGYEFILGMYLGSYLNSVHSKWMVLSVPVVVFFFTSNTALNCNTALKITILALAFFISFSYLENILCKWKLKGLDLLSGLSYELFLVHHIVIYEITPRTSEYVTSKLSVLVLFIVQLLLMVILALLLKWISSKLIQLILKKRKCKTQN